jgi:hypothetical protein
MAYQKTRIFGGSFQTSSGSPISNGWLRMKLNQDSNVSLPTSQVVGGVSIKVPLDNLGRIAGNVYVWTDDILNPTKSFYVVDAYTSQGLLAWIAPQYWVLASGGPIDVGNIIPTNI